MISQISQENATTQTSQIIQKQDTQAIQQPEQQKPQAPQKDSVTLSQEAKNLAAQTSGTTAQQNFNAPPTAEQGLSKLFQ